MTHHPMLVVASAIHRFPRSAAGVVSGFGAASSVVASATTGNPYVTDVAAPAGVVLLVFALIQSWFKYLAKHDDRFWKEGLQRVRDAEKERRTEQAARNAAERRAAAAEAKVAGMEAELRHYRESNTQGGT